MAHDEISALPGAEGAPSPLPHTRGQGRKASVHKQEETLPRARPSCLHLISIQPPEGEEGVCCLRPRLPWG